MTNEGQATRQNKVQYTKLCFLQFNTTQLTDRRVSEKFKLNTPHVQFELGCLGCVIYTLQKLSVYGALYIS